MAAASDPQEFEVVVAGGGVVGATLALALARAGLHVAVADAEPVGAPSRPDPRASAVAAAAVRAWERLGVELPPAQPVRRMAVVDGPTPGAAQPGWALRAALQFDADEAGEGPLGYLLENAELRPALVRAAHEAGATWLPGARVVGVEVGSARARVRLADGRGLEAPLVVGADGRASPVRETAGIGTTGRRYRQEGVAAAVALARPHEGVARQLFLPTGPLAALPLRGDRASLVWSTSPADARALVEGPPELFEAALSRALGDGAGPARLDGPRARFPLELRLAQSMVAPRIALAGDAAHVIHPVAGQGLNLGLKDAAALAEVIADARRIGEDVGSGAVLERYARWRRLDRLTLAAGADAFVRLFSTTAPLARLARTAAFAAADASAPLRRAFMREAAGAAGDLPRLFRGEAL